MTRFALTLAAAALLLPGAAFATDHEVHSMNSMIHPASPDVSKSEDAGHGGIGHQVVHTDEAHTEHEMHTEPGHDAEHEDISDSVAE
ncbi:MAG TPA: hypothetical protein DDX54_04150 [Rhodospirillaceae bacterium]|nr:hypothetical protein [Alphaproteobacteria bacterium]HBH26577.1 hypothetical protein [Rhodospirillaceae bacterium]